MTRIVFSLLAFTDALVTYPRLDVTHTVAGPLFARVEHVARCEPLELLRWNPTQGWWRTEAGLKISKITVALGHVSNHGIGMTDRLDLPHGLGNESYNYVRAEYVLEF